MTTNCCKTGIRLRQKKGPFLYCERRTERTDPGRLENLVAEGWRGPIGRLHFLREVREEAIRCQRGRSKGAREELLECSWV